MLPAIMLLGLFGLIALAARQSEGSSVDLTERKALGPVSKKDREREALVKNLRAQVELANVRHLPEDYERVAIAARKLGLPQTSKDAIEAAKWHRGKLVRKLSDEILAAESSRRSAAWLRVADTAAKAGRPDWVANGRKNAARLRAVGR